MIDSQVMKQHENDAEAEVIEEEEVLLYIFVSLAIGV